MNKTPTFTTFDEYIASYPTEIQSKLTKLRKFIKDILPESEESISYQMPTFKMNGKPIVYFAAFSKHIGFYPFPSGIKKFAKESKDYKTSTGTIQFPHEQEIPWELVKKMVEFRLHEHTQKYLLKKSKT